jgi:hydroxysqualene synthase
MESTLVSSRTASSENFPVASFLIAPSRRPTVLAFYRFARQADDVADDPNADGDAKAATLALFDQGLQGGSTGPQTALDLRAILLEQGLSLDHPRHLLQAFSADARNRPCRSWSDLIAYCRFSAAPVGRFLLDLHGEDRSTWNAADALCTSLQILNHLQDAKQDWADLRRLYVPRDWLVQAGLSERDLLAQKMSPQMRAVYDRVLDRVHELNVQAKPLCRAIADRRLRMEAAAIHAIACHLAKRLRRLDPLAMRVAPTRLGKFAALLHALRAGVWR